MKLLIETIESTEIITEGEGNDRRHFIHGIFLQAGIKNKNGRVYPPSVMENEVNRYIKEKVSRNCAYGELGHPMAAVFYDAAEPDLLVGGATVAADQRPQ